MNMYVAPALEFMHLGFVCCETTFNCLLPEFFVYQFFVSCLRNHISEALGEKKKGIDCWTSWILLIEMLVLSCLCVH